jgi:hypothetical protein
MAFAAADSNGKLTESEAVVALDKLSGPLGVPR